MIYLGKNIKSSQDVLQSVAIDLVARSIQTPKPETLALIRQLRIIRSIDANKYKTIKLQLPYLVCGTFNPPYRKTENFAFTQFFILDIDHISQKEQSLHEVRERIQSDSRVMMCFVSPSEDGLKVLFQLSQRCYDANVFSLFYKLFASSFSKQYNLEQVIDIRTCDVTRACFVSCDPDVYFNPNSEKVDYTQYANDDNAMDFFDSKHKLEQEANNQPVPPPESRSDVGADVISNIKAILQPWKEKANPPTPVYVPQQLSDIMEDLQSYIEKTGVVVTEVISIQYGKKIRARIGLKQAETNVFYGKRGFSVVISPRSGTDEETNQLLSDLIQSYLDTL